MKLELPRQAAVLAALPTRRYLPPAPLAAWPPVSTWSDDLWRSWLTQHDWLEPQIDQYLWHDRYAYGFGLKPDGTLAGVDDAQDTGVTWLYRPSPTGVQLHASACPNIMFGGEAGGTKSHTCRWHVLMQAWKREGFRAIIVRRELEELRRSHWDKFEREVFLIGQVLENPKALRLTTQPAVLAIDHNGAKIIGAHCHNHNDHEKYLTEDYDLFFGDEATQLLEKQIVGIASRVRNDPKTGRIGQMVLSTNPGGPSHGYCVRHFLSKAVSADENPQYDPSDYTFIRAKLHDNPFYVDPDGSFTSYEKRLSALSRERRRQLMYGDWESVVGQFFAEFDGTRHVQRESLPEKCHLEIWLRSGAGGKAPYACWVALLPDGRLHVFAELLGEGIVMGAFASAVHRLTNDEVIPTTKGRLVRTIGSADMFPSSTEAIGESPSDTCRRAGLYLQKGDDQELFGWERLRHWWGTPPLNPRPWLTIDPDCAFMARTLPTLVQDDAIPDALSEHADTQAAHALRIGVMARPTPSPIPRSHARVPDGAIKRQFDKELGGRGGRRFGMVN